MIKLGVNSVLFKNVDFATAAKMVKKAGYDGIEISAIKGMCEHLVLDEWQSQAEEIKQIAVENELEILSMEVASLDEERLTLAFAAAQEIGIPVVNIGPGGKSDVEEDLQQAIANIQKLADLAASYGVSLGVKAHVGNAVYNTPTTLRMIEEVSSPGFGVDMDPSHIYRAGEDPAEALPQVVSAMKHVHIRDCKGRQAGPGPIELQACGRGDIDLFGYCKALVDANYTGPVCLEVIGATEEHTLADVSIVAAESYGYLHAILKSLGAR